SLLCILNGQITYNEWKEIQETHPAYATLYLCSQINGQDKALRYAKNMTSKMLSSSDSTAKKLDSTFAIPDRVLIAGDLLVMIVDWIEERPQLWNLDIRNLTLYARLDIYGDSETKQYVKEKLTKALFKES
ncbi:MAG: hypothetical protein QF795_05905, partial [Candidatus Marinimicrobia bacterium]|nr:hypothetical protein [Candidatus Neomarinimicrobiota bacterium]